MEHSQISCMVLYSGNVFNLGPTHQTGRQISWPKWQAHLDPNNFWLTRTDVNISWACNGQLGGHIHRDLWACQRMSAKSNLEDAIWNFPGMYPCILPIDWWCAIVRWHLPCRNWNLIIQDIEINDDIDRGLLLQVPAKTSCLPSYRTLSWPSESWILLEREVLESRVPSLSRSFKRPLSLLIGRVSKAARGGPDWYCDVLLHSCLAISNGLWSKWGPA